MPFDVHLTRPQWEFFRSRAKYVAAVAGYGSGKTQAALVRIVATMIDNLELNTAYLAPTYPLIRDIFYPKAEEFLTDCGISYELNKTEHTIQLHGLGKIYCRSMDKPASLVGWEVGDVYLDEFDVLPKDKAFDVFRKASARARQKKPDGSHNQILVTTTPEGYKATYDLFKRDPLKDSELIQMSTYSNAHNLPPGYIEDLKAQYPSQLIDAYLLGKFVNLQSGTVYYVFDREQHNTDVLPADHEPLHVGMDFNVMDMCATVHVLRNQTLYAVGELFGLRDTPHMIETLKERYPGHPVFVYPDASGHGTTSKSASVSDISLLRKAGFTIRAKNKNPFIRDRVAAVNAAFEHGRYFVNTEQCPEFTDALEQQAYDPKTGMPEKDGHIDNRVDGAGYLINYLMPIRRQAIKTRKTTGF